MLDEREIRKGHKEHLPTPEAEAHMVEVVRKSPSPPVHTTPTSGAEVPPPRKNGQSHAFESSPGEYPAGREMEFAGDRIFYYSCQPPLIPISYRIKAGKITSHDSTPDFFIIHRDGAGCEEWLPIEEILKLQKKFPQRFMKDESSQLRTAGEVHEKTEE